MSLDVSSNSPVAATLSRPVSLLTSFDLQFLLMTMVAMHQAIAGYEFPVIASAICPDLLREVREYRGGYDA